MVLGMTTIQFDHRGRAENLWSVRYELENLAHIRLDDLFTTAEEARYDSLCRQELDLLGLAAVSSGPA
jgi:hypothetical protein